MKKILAIIMVVAMVCAASVSVSAASSYTGNKTDMQPNDTTTADVTVAYVDSNDTTITTSGTVYSVDVTFADDLQFKWKITTDVTDGKIVWDPDTHTYKNGTGDSAATIAWTTPDAINNAVTVANHSNATVKVTALIGNEKAATANGCTATLSDCSDENLESAAALHYNIPDNAETATYNLTASGEPADPTNTNFKIGTITVTISAE